MIAVFRRISEWCGRRVDEEVAAAPLAPRIAREIAAEQTARDLLAERCLADAIDRILDLHSQLTNLRSDLTEERR